MRRLADFVDGIVPRRRKAWAVRLADPGAAAIEIILAALPDEAWCALKQSTLAQIPQRDPERGWLQALDLFNEARAYHYLASIGCDEIRLETATMLQKSPDLTAKLDDVLICCEVKTLHLGSADLPRSFAVKLAARLADAAGQLGPHAEGMRRLIYLVGVPPVHRAAVAALAHSLQPNIEILLDGQTI